MISATAYGRVGKDAEIQYLQDGTAILKFSVAVNSTKKDADPTWVRVSMFGSRGETLCPMVHAGDRIVVSGTVEMRKWQSDKGGGVDLDMRADNLDLVETKQESEVRAERSGSAPRESSGRSFGGSPSAARTSSSAARGERRGF